MTLRRTLKYHWLKFRRLQGDPRRLALGSALGIFVGLTPTIPFHTVMVLFLAPLLRISLATSYMGIWISNPVTWVPQYLLAYEVGRYIVFRGEPLRIPEQVNLSAFLDLLWRGGVALQVGGLIIAVPPAIAAYFLTLWAVKRYRQHRARVLRGVHLIPPDSPATSRPEA
jgi:uncharacterized protein (DUF2062 family)